MNFFFLNLQENVGKMGFPRLKIGGKLVCFSGMFKMFTYRKIQNAVFDYCLEYFYQILDRIYMNLEVKNGLNTIMSFKMVFFIFTFSIKS